jgi:hypothetical protein
MTQDASRKMCSISRYLEFSEHCWETNCLIWTTSCKHVSRCVRQLGFLCTKSGCPKSFWIWKASTRWCFWCFLGSQMSKIFETVSLQNLLLTMMKLNFHVVPFIRKITLQSGSSSSKHRLLSGFGTWFSLNRSHRRS